MNGVMNLSNDINVITAEIKSYQQIAGQSIFEIGRRQVDGGKFVFVDDSSVLDLWISVSGLRAG